MLSVPFCIGCARQRTLTGEPDPFPSLHTPALSHRSSHTHLLSTPCCNCRPVSAPCFQRSRRTRDELRASRVVRRGGDAWGKEVSAKCGQCNPCERPLRQQMRVQRHSGCVQGALCYVPHVQWCMMKPTPASASPRHSLSIQIHSPKDAGIVLALR